MKIDTAHLNTGSGKVLVIGNVEKAFAGAGLRDDNSRRVCGNMLDGIDAAVREDFSVIAVVMNGRTADLKSALRTLHQVRPRARLVLLVQMEQEPAARELIESETNGAHLVSDYFICPARIEVLVPGISGADAGAVSAQPAATKEATEYKPEPASVIDRQMQARMKQLEKLATEDDLTDLKNRRYTWEFARQVIERAKRTGGRVTLLVFDIDDFKHYNDVYGHPFGDEILRQAGVLMRRCCRAHDVLGRIGGDEFAVVFWDDPKLKAGGLENERRSADADHPVEAISVAKRFRNELGKTELSLLGPGGKGILTISGGLASFPRDGSTPDELFQQADSALLEAKRSGKNRIYLVGKAESDIADIP